MGRAISGWIYQVQARGGVDNGDGGHSVTYIHGFAEIYVTVGPIMENV